MNILIVGYGVVGHNLEKDLKKLNPDIVDKFKQGVTTKKDGIIYDIAFICVDTPFNNKGDCDITEVLNAIYENDADVYVIKSTILPNTTKRLVKETGKNIIFSPEYYGGTQHCNNFDFNFTILGGDRQHCKKVIQVLQNIYDARHRFIMTDSTTAELVKYMENSWLATKVSFCCQFYEIAKSLGVDYEELRELFLQDERVNKSHTFVYDDHPFWSSHCLNKDVPAIANFANASFLKSVIKFNDKQKNKYKKDL